MKVVDIADLPRSAIDLVDLIGLAATVRLVESMPGILFPVPRGEDNNAAGADRFQQLSDIVGLEAARILIKHYGGKGGMYIPSCKTALRRARNRSIVALYNAGVSVFDLALAWRLSDRQIKSILKLTDTAAPVESNQVEMF